MVDKNKISFSRDISILFVDIVGFSIVSQKMRPADAFQLLKKIFDIINNVVTKHNGTIDKILGDGALCYFSDPNKKSLVPSNHAIRAVACAVNIQRDVFKLNLQHAKDGIPCLPLRIGINTALTYIGEITLNNITTSLVIGEGVDFAKRLEQACTENSILLSPITYKLAASSIDHSYLARIFINIKHSDNFYNAYCLSPLSDLPEEDLSRVFSHTRLNMGLSRGPKRYFLNKPLLIHTNGRSGKILDFSNGGLRVELPVRYSKSISLPFYIGDFDSEIAKQLCEYNLQPIMCQVMWSRSDGNRNQHGLRVEMENSRRAKTFFEIIHDFNSNLTEDINDSFVFPDAS